MRRGLGKRMKTPRTLARPVLSGPGPHPQWPGSSKKVLTVSNEVSRSSPDCHLLWILVPFPDAMRSPPPSSFRSVSYKHSGTEWNEEAQCHGRLPLQYYLRAGPTGEEACRCRARKKPGDGTEAGGGGQGRERERERSKHPTPLQACPESLWTKGSPNILEL